MYTPYSLCTQSKGNSQLFEQKKFTAADKDTAAGGKRNQEQKAKIFSPGVCRLMCLVDAPVACVHKNNAHVVKSKSRDREKLLKCRLIYHFVQSHGCQFSGFTFISTLL